VKRLRPASEAQPCVAEFSPPSIFVTITCAPVALWSLRNRLVSGGASDRHLAFHPVKFSQIAPAFSAAAQWLILGKVRLDFRLVGFIIEVVVAISLAGYLLMRGRSDTSGGEEQSKLPQILIIFLVCYVGLLLLTITFLEDR